MQTISEKELTYVIHIMHKLSKEWHLSISKVYKLLRTTGILDDYLIKNYSCLHSLGDKYLVEDISAFVRDKGIEV